MSHHGNNPFENEDARIARLMADLSADIEKSRDQLVRKLADTTGFVGALGTHPEGKLKPEDEGAIQFAIGSEDGKVIVDYGTSVKWVAFTPQEAADFASTLLAEARKAGRKQGQTIALTIGGSQ